MAWLDFTTVSRGLLLLVLVDHLVDGIEGRHDEVRRDDVTQQQETLGPERFFLGRGEAVGVRGGGRVGTDLARPSVAVPRHHHRAGTARGAGAWPAGGEVLEQGRCAAAGGTNRRHDPGCEETVGDCPK